MYHKPAGSAMILIKDMEDSHLKNTVKLILRKATIPGGIWMVNGGNTVNLKTGSIETRRKELNEKLRPYLNEIRRRKLVI